MGNLLSLIGWTFLPNLATSWLQSILYGVTIRAGSPHPRPGSPTHTRHRRRIHIAVVSLYLAYTLYEADYDLLRQGSFYADLGGLAPSATEREVKARFRRLAALYHPDKVAGGAADEANARFIGLKIAAETLQDPARRFAYDRFGPTVVASTPSWHQAGCATLRDYVHRGVTSVILPQYAAAAAGMWVLGALGYLDGAGAGGRFWRWLLWAAAGVLEYHMATRARDRMLWGALEGLVNPALATWTAHPALLPFQLVGLLRKTLVTLYIGMNQLGPAVLAELEDAAAARSGGGGSGDGIGAPGGAHPGKVGSAEHEAELVRRGLDGLEASAGALAADADRLLGLELAPFAGDGEALNGVGRAVRHWLVQNTIRSDPMVRDAMGRSLRKRRTDAPAGARGNR